MIKLKPMANYCCKVLIVLMTLGMHVVVEAQNVKEFDSKYLEAKQLLSGLKYIKAMEAFKPLMLGHKNNHHAAEACYFFANAAYKVKDYSAVKIGVTNLQTIAPNWANMDDAHLLLAATYFAKNNYSLALGSISKITNQAVVKEALNLESQYIHALLNTDTLLVLHNLFPNDALVTNLYGAYVTVKQQKEKNKQFVIATVLPFNLKGIKVEAINRDNQYVLDLYQGMKMAVATLETKGVSIDLRAYEADKDSVRLLALLNKPEFKSIDLLIGPIYNQQVSVAARQMAKSKVAVVNPLSDNIKALQKNKNALLFKASQQTQAIKTAEFAYKNFENKTTLVIYGKSPRDTAFAKSFKDKYTELGGNVFIYKQVDKFNSTNLTQLLGKDTLLNAGCVLVCHSEQMVASNIVTAVAIHNTNTPVITYYDWLDYTSINFEQFEKYNFHFISPGYVDFEKESVRQFKTKYLENVHIFPSEYAFWGYDLMMYYGTLLQKYGPDFYTKLEGIPEIDGALIEDHLYGNNQDNQLFPILKFEKSKLVQVR
jgi:ABC-type branched-subunit amino acid transport system substrate-binding protein